MRGRRLWLFFLVLLVAFLCRGASARAMEPEELEEEDVYKRQDGDRETRDGACVRIYDAGGNFLALYRYHREAEEYTTVKMFCGS